MKPGDDIDAARIADSIRSIIDNSKLSSFQREILDKGAKELEANVDLFVKEFNKAVDNARKVQENAQNSESNAQNVAENAQDKQYSIMLDQFGNNIPIINVSQFSKNSFNSKDKSNAVFEYVKNQLIKLDGKSVQIKNTNPIKVVNFDKHFANHYVSSEDTQRIYHETKALKMNASFEVESIIENAKVDKLNVPKNSDHDNRNGNADRGFDYYKVEFAYPNSNGSYDLCGAHLVVRKDANGLDYAYDLEDMRIKKKNVKLTPINGSATGPSSSKMNIRHSSNANNTTTTNNKSTKKNKHSLIIDAEGNNLSEGQVEYFKESKVRDENGNLKIVYHGTGRADRVGYVFDPNRATSGPKKIFRGNKIMVEKQLRKNLTELFCWS